MYCLWLLSGCNSRLEHLPQRPAKPEIITTWPFTENIRQALLQSTNINDSLVFQLLVLHTPSYFILETFLEISICPILQMRKLRTKRVRFTQGHTAIRAFGPGKAALERAIPEAWSLPLVQPHQGRRQQAGPLVRHQRETPGMESNQADLYRHS